MREGSMSEVMAETSEGHTSNVPGNDAKLWLVPREMLDHCLRKMCDTWRAHQQSVQRYLRLAKKAVRTQTMFESIV